MAGTTTYWVLKTNYTSAVIEKLPEGAPPEHLLDEGTRLGDRFPPNASVRFSDEFATRRTVCDFMSNTFGSLIASARVRRILEAQGADNCEFIPLTLLDHKGKVASREHFLLNVLGHAEAVDLERSVVDMDSILKDRIAYFDKLVLRREGIPPDARIFRLSRKRNEFLISQAVHDAFTQEGVTGFKAFLADGWDGQDF